MRAQISIDWMFGFLMLLSALAVLAATNSKLSTSSLAAAHSSYVSESLISDSFELESSAFLRNSQVHGALPFNPRGNCLAYENSSQCVMMPFRMYSSQSGVVYENALPKEPV